MNRKSYPSDVSDDEWVFVATLFEPDERSRPTAGISSARSLQRVALDRPRGAARRMLPNDLPPWHVVYDQTHRWRRDRWIGHGNR